MPTFTPRSAEEILNDMVNYLTLNTKITDFNVGSAIRTILEAAALEDAQLYTQCLKILQSFFLEGAYGQDLIDRGEEYDLTKFVATPSTGTVKFLDTQLERTFLSVDANAGDTIISVVDTSVFPSTPFTVKFGEGTGSVEVATVNAVTAASNTLTLAAGLVYSHPAATSSVDEIDNLSSLVTFVSGNPDRVLSSGISLRSKGSNVNITVEAYTSSNGTLQNGYFASSDVSVITKQVGADSVIPEKRLNSIIGSPPFSGATVVNLAEISGGKALETDSEFKSRIREKIGGLSAGVLAAFYTALLEVTDTTAGQQISKINVLESFSEDVVYTYINPGLGTFNGSKDEAITDTLAVALTTAATEVQVTNASDFPQASAGNLKYLILDVDDANSKLQTVQYQELASNTVAITSTIQGGATLPIGTQVAVPTVVSTSTQPNIKYYFINDNIPIVRNSFSLFQVVLDPTATPPISASVTKKLILDTDYILNEAVGQIEFLDANTSSDGVSHLPPVGSVLLAIFDSWTGLVKNAQDALDGSLANPSANPGVRSAGVKVLVEPAQREIIDFIIDIFVNIKITSFETAKFLTEQVVIAYISSLDIGSPIILTDIIDRVKDIPGITDLEIKSPSANVVVLQDHYADIGALVVT